MPVTFNERLIAYLTLASGLSISAVAIYYSVVGLTSIFAAATMSIIIMGTVLEISKLVATVWLKQNWSITPWSVRGYLLTAIISLMFITSIGIFGFLSKAHSDQTLVSGDVTSKLSLYDEKIKIQKENIEAARKALQQMDAQVDARLSRGDSEQGAERAVQIRRQQQGERSRLLKEIGDGQKEISKLNEERAPIAAEVRKVEAEVGPLKYIAAFIYGETDQTILEKAVTWVIILIVVVFDPLAVVLLLASQISFQNFRERQRSFEKESLKIKDEINFLNEATLTPPVEEGDKSQEHDTVIDIKNISIDNIEPTEPIPYRPETHPYLNKGFAWPKDWQFVKPIVAGQERQSSNENKENLAEDDEDQEISSLRERAQKLQENVKLHGYSSEKDIVKVAGENYSLDEFNKLMAEPLYVQNEEQKESNLWNSITQDEYLKAIKQKQSPKE